MDIEPLLPPTVDRRDKKQNQIICVVLGFGNLFILVTLLIVLVPNSRVHRINTYNEAVDQWDTTPSEDRDFSNFTVQSKASRFTFHQVTQPHGSHYIYRDNRISKRDPDFREASVNHYSLSLPFNLLDEKHRIEIVDSLSGTTVYNQTIYTKQVFYLPSTSIHCNSGSKDSCPTKCRSLSGEWVDKKCVLTGYLHTLCLRLRPSSPDFIDFPPELDLSGHLSGVGCEHHATWEFSYLESTHPWSPTQYFFNVPDNITITLRHYRDPYIRAGVITSGCTSLYETAHNCFGNPPLIAFEIQVLFVLISLLFLLIDVVLVILYRLLYSRNTDTNDTNDIIHSFISYVREVFSDDIVGGTPVDLPLEEKSTTLFTPVETPRTPLSMTSENSGGNMTPMSTYDHDGEHSDRMALLSAISIQNRYKGDSDGI